MSNLADKLAEYDGLLDTCKTDFCNSGHYVTFSFFDQKGDLLMRSTGHPVSYEDLDDYRRFPHSKDNKGVHVDITARGTCQRLSISLYDRDGKAIGEDITMPHDLIQLAPGNSMTITANDEGFLHATTN